MINTQTLINNDCLKVMNHIDGGTVDLIVTDPPYLINYKSRMRSNHNDRFTKPILNDDNPELIKKYIEECYRILKKDSAMYMFCSIKTIDFFKQNLEKYFTIKNSIIWNKGHFGVGDLSAAFGNQYEVLMLVNKGRKSFNGKRIGDIWNFNKIIGKQQLHQNQKPVELLEQCLEKHSASTDLVFDGFMGSNSTGIACLNKNRNYIGAELEKYQYEIAVDRTQKYIKNNSINTNLLLY